MKIKVCTTRLFEVEISDNSELKKIFDTKDYNVDSIVKAVKEVEELTGIEALNRDDEILDTDFIIGVTESETDESIFEW